MKEDDIKKILDDLYSLDPELRGREPELIAIIRSLSIKPDVHVDAVFAVNLRRRLLAELSTNVPAVKKRPGVRHFFRMDAYRYGIIAIVAIAAAGVAIYSITRLSDNGGSAGPVALNNNVAGMSITTVGPNAFGSLSTLGAASSSVAAAPMVMAPNTVGTSSIGTSPSARSNVLIMPVRPIYQRIEYRYTGGPIVQDQTSLDVLKKIPASFTADTATAALLNTGFGPIDFSTFADAGITNVTLSENQPYGYQIYIDLTNGTISISENYSEWPQSTGTVKPLTASEIPSDSATIALANQFLAAHGIATSTYGAPQVIRQGAFIAVPLDAAAQISGPMIPYYPDSEQVLYPLAVNGMTAYGTGGNPIGMTVEVNIRYRRVTNVSGIDTRHYQSSAYAAITDANEILQLAENSPPYPIIYNGVRNTTGGTGTNTATGTNAVIYDLGTPTLVYEDMYRTNGNSNGENDEFLVPAYAFPVLGNATGMASRMIMVPLIKDFVQRNVPLPAPPRLLPM